MNYHIHTGSRHIVGWLSMGRAYTTEVVASGDPHLINMPKHRVMSIDCD